MREEMIALTGLVLDDAVDISLRELCHLCDISAERVLDMVEEGVADPRGGNNPREWRFSARTITRVQIALRLQRDLRVNLAGAALILDMLEELEELRRLRKHRIL